MLTSFFKHFRAQVSAEWRFVALFFIALSTFGTAQAAPGYLWLEPTAGGSQVLNGTLLPPLDGTTPKVTGALADVRATTGNKTVPATPQGDGFALAFTPTAGGPDLRFTARALDAQGAPVFYLARHGRTDTTPQLDLELVPTEPNGTTFRLYFKGKAVPANQVRVETSSGWRRTLSPAADGSVTLVSPEFPRLFPSRYVMEISAKVSGRFKVGDTVHESALHTTTLSFDVVP